MASVKPLQTAPNLIELSIGGMTCASCAARIEKKLNRMDGVSARVNYATEKAQVSYGEGVRPEDLIATVVETGYTAELPSPEPLVGGRLAADPTETGRASCRERV